MMKVSCERCNREYAGSSNAYHNVYFILKAEERLVEAICYLCHNLDDEQYPHLHRMQWHEGMHEEYAAGQGRLEDLAKSTNVETENLT